MSQRVLTKRFFTYTIAQYEKATGKSLMDLLDRAYIEINKLGELIKIGNSVGKQLCTDEQAYNILDTYLTASPDNSLISAYFCILRELDNDLKLMKDFGINIDDLEKQIKQEISKAIKDNIDNALKENKQ